MENEELKNAAVTGCMMHTEGKCFRDYRFFFDK